MTLTASTAFPSAGDRAALGDAGAQTWFTTVDHRTVGRLLTGASLTMGVTLLAFRALVSQRIDDFVRGALLDDAVLGSVANAGFSFDRVANLVATGLAYFVILPLFLGLATAAVPGQIGARRLAFPRLQAFVLWGYVLSCVGLFAAFVAAGGAPQVHLMSSQVPKLTGMANRGTNLYLGAVMAVTILTILGALNILVTVATRRRPGLRIHRIRPFAFASLATSGILVIASPVFLAGLSLLTMDAHFGGKLFTLAGSSRVWGQMIWLYGRPEALLVVLPALGAVIDVLVGRVGRQYVRFVNPLLGVYAAMTLLAWTADSWKLGRMVQPHSSLVTALIGLPLALLVALGLAAIIEGRRELRSDASLLFVFGFGLAILGAVVATVLAAIVGVKPPGSATWALNQSTLWTVGIPLIGLLAGVIELLPRLRGRRVPPAVGALAGVLVVAGLGVEFFAVMGTAVRGTFTDSATLLSALAMIAGALGAFGVGVCAIAIVSSVLTQRSPSELEVTV